MNKHLLTLLIICLGIFLPQVVLGDTVPTEGTWGKERYRSIIPNPPTVSIDGNLLSIHFIDALDDLTVQVVNEQGAILYNEVVSGEAGIHLFRSGWHRMLLSSVRTSPRAAYGRFHHTK